MSTDSIALLAGDVVATARAKWCVVCCRRELDMKVGFMDCHRPSELKSQEPVQHIHGVPRTPPVGAVLDPRLLGQGAVERVLYMQTDAMAHADCESQGIPASGLVSHRQRQ